ncbi:hypothetical protein MCO_00547 [Bartonella sp. DB5-6]|nr:hypothetical protein MCO_00547 [Bartonella sp. DB5-6]
MLVEALVNVHLDTSEVYNTSGVVGFEFRKLLLNNFRRGSFVMSGPLFLLCVVLCFFHVLFA